MSRLSQINLEGPHYMAFQQPITPELTPEPGRFRLIILLQGTTKPRGPLIIETRSVLLDGEMRLSEDWLSTAKRSFLAEILGKSDDELLSFVPRCIEPGLQLKALLSKSQDQALEYTSLRRAMQLQSSYPGLFGMRKLSQGSLFARLQLEGSSSLEDWRQLSFSDWAEIGKFRWTLKPPVAELKPAKDSFVWH